MISSGVSILDNNESDNSKDRLLGTQSELELGQSSDFYYRKIRQSGWDLYSQWIYVIIFMHLFYPILKNISQVNRGKIFTDSYDSTIILIGYIKGRIRKYDKLGA